MSISILNFSPISITQGNLFRRGLNFDEEQLQAKCVGTTHTDLQIKLCKLVTTSMKNNEAKIFDCVSKCKSEECPEECIYSSIGFDVNKFESDPFMNASKLCPSPTNLKSCKEACKSKEKVECENTCEKLNIYGDISCIGKKVDLPEEAVVDFVDCTKGKCLDTSDLHQFQTCYDSCVKKANEEKSNNSKQSDKPTVPKGSSSNRISISGLNTVAFTLMCLFGNN